jgi:hypothetical protein
MHMITDGLTNGLFCRQYAIIIDGFIDALDAGNLFCLT